MDTSEPDAPPTAELRAGRPGAGPVRSADPATERDGARGPAPDAVRPLGPKGEQTRSTILAAAIERFGRDGFRATSVADIARDAGVGPTAVYAYFPGKEALFLAAVDEDAAAVIEEGLAVVGGGPLMAWRHTLFLTLLDSVERHPLARRLLAGLEPEVIDRVLEVPALAEMRKVCTEQVAAAQLAGVARPEIDAAAVANGLVTITLSLLMSLVQLGGSLHGIYAPDVEAVFDAALLPEPRDRPAG